MLRHFGQHGGGVKVYTHALLKHFAAMPREHEFVFFYNNPDLVGAYRNVPHIKEVVVPNAPSIVWDQYALPREAAKYGLDVLFNPKYSIPLSMGCPTSWVCHGLDWYVMPWASKWVDRLSHKFLVPRYASKARAIIAVSENTREHVTQFLNVEPERVHTVYTGVDDCFRVPLDDEQLEAVRHQYQLPERFLLYAGAVYPPKNFRRMIQAYAQVGPKLDIPLVIAGGQNRFLSEDEIEEPKRLKLGNWVQWAGWVENTTLPAFYQMAEALLLPSLFESFGIPILEAMASGCPVLTSNRYGSKEVAADAAVLVEPESLDSIAEGIRMLVENRELKETLIAKGYQRSREFTWERCASQTLNVLEAIGQPGSRRHRVRTRQVAVF
jgi:glycosyltransferase involved in cell wall biosynthesis